MGLSAFQRVQLVAVALVITTMVMTARERLRTERHCRVVATIVVDCWEPRR